jgi:hypothetical protein
MHKTAPPTPEFVVAHSLAPKAELAAWLAQQPATALLRVPVELDVSVLGVRGAALGFAADRLEVKVNDSALGESLADHAMGWCPGQDRCAMWVWANWKDGGLRVTRAEAAIPAGERVAATHLFVAK